MSLSKSFQQELKIKNCSSDKKYEGNATTITYSFNQCLILNLRFEIDQRSLVKPELRATIC